MIEYLQNLPDEEQAQMTGLIRLLMRQTFLLERKYDKKTGRLLFNREYRVCSRHLEFLKDYFRVAGIELNENTQAGVMYLRGEDVLAQRLSKLATLYLLVLKLIYDEQMSQASASIHIFTTLGELNERLGSFQLLKDRPSMTEIRRTLNLLKRYQVIEVLDPMEELLAESRLLIYPCINMVLFGEDVHRLLAGFTEEGEETDGDDSAGTKEEGAV